MPVDDTRERLLALVTWEWQDVEALIEQLVPAVAPGTALRTYDQRSGKHAKGTSGRAPLTEMEKIASGARSILNARIGSQIENGRLERRILEDGTRQVRFRERREVADARGCCPTCNRPFEKATATPPPIPSPSSKVVYPAFPQWAKQGLREGSSG